MIAETITLPAYWASALVNGDYSGLTDSEAAICREYEARLAADGLSIADVARDDDGEGQEARFTWSYRLYCPEAGCDGGEVLDYIALRHAY